MNNELKRHVNNEYKKMISDCYKRIKNVGGVITTVRISYIKKVLKK